MALVAPTPPAKAGLALQLAGETLWLTPDRALVWPRRRWVIIADPHFGKTAAFQRAGLGLPNGVDGDDLERLGQLVTTWDAEVVVVLGDFFHGVEALDPEGTFGLAFRAFCQRFAERSFAVGRGNHDRWALDFGGWGGHWRWLEGGERVEAWALYQYAP
ncbi:MAG: metallophosphoesterase, partial [Candidatus Competibacterales bacterium]